MTDIREQIAREIEIGVRTPPGAIPSEVTRAYMRAAMIARGSTYREALEAIPSGPWVIDFPEPDRLDWTGVLPDDDD